MIELKNQDLSTAGKIKLLSDIIEQRLVERKQLEKEVEKKAELIRSYGILLTQLQQLELRPQ